MDDQPIRVAIYGATGLVGGHCLKLLAAEPRFERIVVPVRRMPHRAFADPRIEIQITDFDDVFQHRPLLQTDAVICALGTTIKKAGSRQRFREIDHGLPISIARIALQEGVSHFLLVSAIGADPDSRIFYNRVKGEVERDLLEIGFPIVTIVRPSLLLGDRGEFRLGEEIAKRFEWVVPGRYRPVATEAVARALVHRVAEATPGTEVFESDDIRKRFG